MKYGYMRSNETDNNELQDSLQVELNADKVYIDRVSNTNSPRPQLKDMVSSLFKGDTVIVKQIDNLARNTNDLIELIGAINLKGAIFISVVEHIDTSTDSGQFLLGIFSAEVALERDYLKARRQEGIDAAKEKGLYKGRKRIEIDDKFTDVYNEYKAGGITVDDATNSLNLTRSTFYRRVREYKKKDAE